MSVVERKIKPIDLSSKTNKDDATRNSSGAIMAELQDIIPNMIGGSADLSGSTKIKGKFGDFPKGNNINFGVRDFAMPAITNGMQLHGGVVPFCSTFFVFSDYGKPPIRMAALMEIPTLFVFSHDSIFVGEDGATHQPVEHNAMFRSLPNLNFIRPADEVEVAAAYMIALESKTTPTVIVTTRQNIVSLENSSIAGVKKGGYIVQKEQAGKKLDAVIVATGSEVGLAIKAANEIKDKNIRVVSMPCTELFDVQNEKYQEDTIPKDVFTLVMEAATTFG
jgi:transketolase